MESGELLLTTQHGDNVHGAVWNADESQLLTWSSDGTAKIWDTESGDLLLIVQHGDNVDGAVWNGV